MITPKNLQTLREIKIQQKEEGAALAPKISVYEYRTNLYKTLDKLEKLNAIDRQPAPNTSNVENTYTITEFGENLIRNAQHAGMI